MAELFRTLDRESQKDRALNRLLAAARRGSAADVEALAEVVERLLRHFGRRGRPRNTRMGDRGRRYDSPCPMPSPA